VIPEINGYTANLRKSADFVIEKQAELMSGATAAVMQKIMANEKAAAAMMTTMQQAAEQVASGSTKQDAAFQPGTGMPTTPKETP
jgi:hypothetical protein